MAEQRDWQKREAVIEGVKAHFVEAEGRISAIERKEEKLQITLKDSRVWRLLKGEREREEGSFVPGILVTVKAFEKEKELGIGQMLEVKGEAEAFLTARNPGGFDSKAYYHALGLDFKLYGEELTLVDRNTIPLLEGLRQAREWAGETLYRFTEEKDAGIFSAAVLGDKTGIDRDLKVLYQKNGIAHLLAISGLHMSFFGLFFYRCLRKAGLGYAASGLAGAGVICLYGILTGGSASVFRACVMMGTGFLASYLGRTYDLLSAASLALLLLALRSPLLLAQGGVQLSFGAVFAIGGAAPVVQRWLGGEKSYSGTIGAAAAIQIVTMPVVAFHFYQIPFYGVILNLLAVPLMGGVLCSGLAVIFLGRLWPVLGTGAAGAGHYILRLYEALCRGFCMLPHYTVITGRPVWGRLLGYGILAAFWLMALKWNSKEKKEEKEGKKKDFSAGKLMILALTYGLFVLFLQPSPVKGLEAVFLDVGQGDGILLRTGKTCVLIDGGSSSDKSLGEYTLEPCLKSLGVSVIDYAFVSHGDLDHLSGVKYLLKECGEVTVKHLLLPCLGREEESIKELEALGRQRGARVHYLTAGEKIFAEGLKIQCLYPEESDGSDDINGESLVLKADYGDCHMLFTGDMGEKEEERLTEREKNRGILAEINVLKTAHHGSKYSSSERFLDEISPKWAVISYGAGNSYGHPHKEVLDRMEERKITIWKTAESGAVLMKTDGKRIRFQGMCAP